MPGSQSAGCPPMSECCPDYTPPARYYATFTNVGTSPISYGCDCVETVVVPIDLYAYGDFDTHPACLGCKVGENWYDWRGDATEDGCFDPGLQLRFCVRLECNPAGTLRFAAYVSIVCLDPVAPACDHLVPELTLPFADEESCDPFYLRWTTDFTLGSVGCCRATNGDGIAGQWTLEITE